MVHLTLSVPETIGLLGDIFGSKPQISELQSCVASSVVSQHARTGRDNALKLVTYQSIAFALLDPVALLSVSLLPRPYDLDSPLGVDISHES